MCTVQWVTKVIENMWYEIVVYSEKYARAITVKDLIEFSHGN